LPRADRPLKRARVRPRLVGETLQFMRRLWELVHALDVSSKRMARTIGVTGPQRLVVRIVGQMPGATASEIATTLGIHPSTLTGILARLERRGVLYRSVDAADRRRARFRLTAAGKRIDRQRRGTVEAAVRRALADASDDAIAHAEHVLALLVDSLERG
jgi:MarR family transcriptional regulator, organic hydroperoxide resistance regulator